MCALFPSAAACKGRRSNDTSSAAANTTSARVEFITPPPFSSCALYFLGVTRSARATITGFFPSKKRKKKILLLRTQADTIRYVRCSACLPECCRMKWLRTSFWCTYYVTMPCTTSRRWPRQQCCTLHRVDLGEWSGKKEKKDKTEKKKEQNEKKKGGSL